MRLALFFSVLLCLPSSVGAQILECDADGACRQVDVPDRDEDPTRPHWEAIGAGAGLLAVSWISNLVVGLLAGQCAPGIYVGTGPGCSPESEWDAFRTASVVPLLGPWIQLGEKPTAFDADGWAAWLIVDGIAQLAGLTTLIVGLATRRARRRSAPSVSIIPAISPHATMLHLDARF